MIDVHTDIHPSDMLLARLKVEKVYWEGRLEDGTLSQQKQKQVRETVNDLSSWITLKTYWAKRDKEKRC